MVVTGVLLPLLYSIVHYSDLAVDDVREMIVQSSCVKINKLNT